MLTVTQRLFCVMLQRRRHEGPLGLYLRHYILFFVCASETNESTSCWTGDTNTTRIYRSSSAQGMSMLADAETIIVRLLSVFRGCEDLLGNRSLQLGVVNSAMAGLPRTNHLPVGLL